MLLKLAATLAATGVLAQHVVPHGLAFMRRRFSSELFQTAVVAYCLSCAWVSNRLRLSHELGAFLAGIMLGSSDGREAVLHSTEQVRVRSVAPWRASPVHSCALQALFALERR